VTQDVDISRLSVVKRAARLLLGSLDAKSLVTAIREVSEEVLGADGAVLAVNEDGGCVSVDTLGAVDWSREVHDAAVERCVRQHARLLDEKNNRALAYAGRFGDATYVVELKTRSRQALQGADVQMVDLLAEFATAALRNVALYYEVEERRAAVLELNQTKSDLIAMLAHDFRGPLTSIVGFADLAGEVGSLTDEQRDFLQTIKDSALQLNELATDTLTLARLERNEVALQLAEVDLLHLITSIVAQHTERRTVSVSFEGTGDAHVTGDEDRLRQVFANLIDNAIKYTPEGPDPVITITGGADTVEVAVRDYGIGIPAGEMSRIFDRFSRASNARKHRISGTGFGLFLSKQLVRLHGGTIAVESVEGAGSTFTVVLPRRADRRNAPRTVLLLDNRRDASYLAQGLQDAGYRVILVSTIEEALTTADAQPLDAVLLTGAERLDNHAAVQFRTFGREYDLPIIAVGTPSPRLGAAATLPSPVRIADLAGALDQLLLPKR
jgi:signal transduction histidine kinase